MASITFIGHDGAERTVPFEPGEKRGVGRRQARPQQFDVLRIGRAESGDGGFREPR